MLIFYVKGVNFFYRYIIEACLRLAFIHCTAVGLALIRSVFRGAKGERAPAPKRGSKGRLKSKCFLYPFPYNIRHFVRKKANMEILQPNISE